jgi:hypothetical protein
MGIEIHTDDRKEDGEESHVLQEDTVRQRESDEFLGLEVFRFLKTEYCSGFLERHARQWKHGDKRPAFVFRFAQCCMMCRN